MSDTRYAQAGSGSDDGGRNTLHLLVALALLLALILLPFLFKIGPNSWRNCAGAPAVAQAAPSPVPAAPTPEPVAVPEAVAPAPAAPVAAAPVEAAPVAPPPAARVYFAVNRTGLPDDVGARLADVLAWLKANPTSRAEISGFHDPRGRADRNHALAEGRAVAVQRYLKEAGVAEDRLILKEPSETTGSGDYQEARRVEVTIAP